MEIFGEELRFWIAILLVIVFKLYASKAQSFRNGVATVSAALLGAWIGTDPILKYFEASPEDYKISVAVVIALVSENLMRAAMELNLERAIDIFKKVTNRD